MSAVPTNNKRERQSASRTLARHSGEGRNLVSPQRGSSSHDGSGWKELRLDEAVEIIRGITFPSGAKAKVPSGDSVACLRTTNVQREVEWDDLWYVAKSFVKRESQFVRENDILISNANSYELVGKVAFIRNVPTSATLGTFITLFRTRPGNDPRFVYFQLSSSEVQAAIRSMASTTTNISNISTAKLARIVLRFPSLSKQRQIVAEIEKQFTRLDAGVAALRRVQANLKRYRAAVLKAACEGRLVPTEAELAKTEGRTYEAGEQLLARILADRRKNWHGRGKYKEPTAPEPAIGSELPNGWVWTGFEQLADGTKNAIKAGPFGSALKKSSYAPTGYKIYGQEQVIRGDPYYGDYFIPSDLFERLRSCEVKAGDILISLVGTPGKVLVLPMDCPPGIINPRLLKLSLHVSSVHPKFIKLLLESTTTRTFFKLAAHGGTMEILNLGILKSLPIALPPLAEQTRIVAEVERRLSVIEELEAAIAANLQRATRLRQSILQKAFAETT